MAIRAALGASPGVLAGGIARSALSMTSLGMIVGLGVAFLVSQWLSHVVNGVDTHDPVAFGAVVVVLLTVALLASVLPARRAARVDPARVLRS
jgi:ABC-type antimicrobial peptide transport system permease subunit